MTIREKIAGVTILLLGSRRRVLRTVLGTAFWAVLLETLFFYSHEQSSSVADALITFGVQAGLIAALFVLFVFSLIVLVTHLNERRALSRKEALTLSDTALEVREQSGRTTTILWDQMSSVQEKNRVFFIFEGTRLKTGIPHRWFTREEDISLARSMFVTRGLLTHPI